MRQPARRFGILVLALTLVPGQLSTADAGVIPWLYDAVFGPVGHYGYGGYGSGGYEYGAPYGNPYYGGQQVSYSASSNYRSTLYAPASCGPQRCSATGCSTTPYYVSYGPVFGLPRLCATVGCSSAVARCGYSPGNCGTCATSSASANSTCDAKTAWKSQDARTEWKAEVLRGEAAVPTPATKDPAPRPKTFADEPVDPATGQPTVVEKATVEDSSAATSTANPGKNDVNWNSTAKPAVATGTSKAANVNEGENAEAVATDAASEPAVGSAGFQKAIGAGDATPADEFAVPSKGVQPTGAESAVPTKTQLLPENLDGELKLEATPGSAADPGSATTLPIELQNQSSFQFSSSVQRIALRAGFGNARLARTLANVEADYVIPSAVTMRLVSR